MSWDAFLETLISTGHFLLWLLVSVAIPVFVPIVFSWLIWSSEPDEDREQQAKKLKTHPIQIIKDGQLLWVTLALCCTGMWEAGFGSSGRALAVCSLLLIATPSVLLLGRYLGETVELPDSRSAWPSRLKLAKKSYFFTACAAVACSIIHVCYGS